LTECFVVLEREIEHHLKSGEKLPLAISVTPIVETDGSCAGAVIILRDLREIKQLQEKVRRTEKLAAIGKLAAGVAHEIRNPLSSIKGFAQFLKEFLENHPNERKYADIMVKEVDRINRVVTDLIIFARPFEAHLTSTDIAKLIEHALLLVQADAVSRDITFIKQFPSEPIHFNLDANQITTAIFNLLLNAVQIIGNGGRIEVGFELSRQNSRLDIWVEDNGPGIPPDQQKKIFEPFYSTREKGTGLGLAIVNKIIENHNGDIKIESPIQGSKSGCRFSIQIPAASS
jgi:two-component system sensor histidine kinase HydH